MEQKVKNKLNVDIIQIVVTHNHFTALLDFVQDYPGEPAPERK